MKNIFVLALIFSIHFFGFSQQYFHLGMIDTLDSKIMSEKRILNIYLPEGYHPDSVYTYPVIYLLDGSADEDFIHTAGLLQFCHFPWINRMPKSILVGIANVDRKRDFTFKTPNLQFLHKIGYDTTAHAYGGSEKFITFINKELQPYINKKYKTDRTCTIIGQSLGGLLATEIFLKSPSMFNNYIILSPSLWWNDESLLKESRALMQKNLVMGMYKVYIGVGKEGKIMVNDSKKLYQYIKKNCRSTEVMFQYFKDEDHGSMSHIALYDAFRKMYTRKK